MKSIWNTLFARCQFPRFGTNAEVQALTSRLARQLDQLSHAEFYHSVVFRQQVTLRLSRIAQEVEHLCQGKVVFNSTETWRSVYEDVLQSCQAKRYLSVAVIRSDDYWRDAPGQSSLEFNYQLISDGFHIHRVFIIDDFYWPPAARTPSNRLFHWISTQCQHGIEVSVIRISALEGETDLICDMGIYGRHAVGIQETESQARTVQFQLHFDAQSMLQAEQRWNQLLLYVTPWDQLVA